jgi:hypothetical protein
MTLQEMYDFVRSHCDADTEDAPDANLKVYARIAFNDILSRRWGWPHLKVKYTFASVIGTSDYTLATLVGGADMKIVSSVSAPPAGNTTGRLVNITRSDADYLYGSNNTALPLAYLVDNETIVLVPTPSQVKTYTVRGFKKPVAWPAVSTSVAPDLPEELHEAICWYMVSSYFMAQEDLDMAGRYLAEYESMVSGFMNHEMRKETTARPQIMGGQNIRLPIRTPINW